LHDYPITAPLKEESDEIANVEKFVSVPATSSSLSAVTIVEELTIMHERLEAELAT
jgi:hypothetical protein